jgi:DNA-binding NarL/FixJ family response regulator
MRQQGIRSVLLADRHQRLSEGIRGLLETSFDVVVMVADELSLLTAIRRLMVDLVVMDVSLSPSSDGLALIRRLRQAFPGTRLIVLSVHDERAVCDAVLAAGADGFVVKRSIVSDLLPAVDRVLSGDRYISPAIPCSGHGTEHS